MRLYLNVIECAIEHNEAFLVSEHPPGSHARGYFYLLAERLILHDSNPNNRTAYTESKRSFYQK
jgi:hypothetical protein